MKKRHKNNVRKTPSSNGDSTKFTTKELLPYAAALAAYLIFVKTSNSIVNYPDLIAFLLYGVASNYMPLVPRLLNEISSKGNYKEYELILTVRKAFLGSYIIEDWQLHKR